MRRPLLLSTSQTGVGRSTGALLSPSANLWRVLSNPNPNPAYVSAVLADGPVAYWRLNDIAPSGPASIKDHSTGGAHKATPVGGITWGGSPALPGGASIRLNGTSGYVACPTAAAAATLGTGSWTVEFWCFPAGNGRLFAAAANSTRRVALELYNSSIYANSDAGGSRSTPTPLTSNWHHIVMTSAGALYVDGLLQSGTSGTSLNSTAGITIGCLNNSTGFSNARFAEVALYDKVLTAARISDHWQTANAIILSGQMFGWSCSTTTPELCAPGSDDTPSLDIGSSIASLSGANVLSVGGSSWRSATFDNPTAFNKWATNTEGTIELEFYYTGSLGNFMLCQLTGKDRAKINDTNDSVKLILSPTGCNLIYNYANGVSTASVSVNASLAANTWHAAQIKWKVGGSPSIAVTVNGTTATASPAIAAPSCNAWHHLLIGNDTAATPTGLYIRNVKAWAGWRQ